MNFLSHDLHIVSLVSAHITLLEDAGEGVNRIFYLWQVKVYGQKNSMNVCFLSFRPRWKDFGFLSWPTSPKCFHKSVPSSLCEIHCYNKWHVETYILHSRTWSLSIGLVHGRGSWKMSQLHRIPRGTTFNSDPPAFSYSLFHTHAKGSLASLLKWLQFPRFPSSLPLENRKY